MTEEPKQDAPARDTSSAESGPEFYARLRAVGGSSHHPFNINLLTRLAMSCWPADGQIGDRATVARVMEIAEAALKAFSPTDEIEAMIAAQAVGLHHAAMAALQRTSRTKQPDAMAVELWREAANLSSAMVEAVNALDRWRRRADPSAV